MIFRKPEEPWTWEIHPENGKAVRQYRPLGIERPIKDVLIPIEGKPHHFELNGIAQFILVNQKTGERVGLDFEKKQFAMGFQAAPFSYVPEGFFYFRRIARTFTVGEKPKEAGVDMEFHFGIFAEGLEPQEMIVR